MGTFHTIYYRLGVLAKSTNLGWLALGSTDVTT